MRSAEMREVAEIIATVLVATSAGTIAEGPNAGQRSRVAFRLDDSVRDRARARVADLLHRHPLYPDIEL
jgi:glycine hydroxymethyltransferase